MIRADMPIAALEVKILRPDAIAAQIAVAVDRDLRPVDEAAIRHVVRARIEEELRRGIDPLFVVQRDLIAVPVAVHEIWIVVAAARIGRPRHLPRGALNVKEALINSAPSS